MNTIKLSFGNDITSTAVSNTFIDRYMANANGTYVKVYLYLLRCLADPAMEVSLPAIADKLDETEKDICRALKYWDKEKVLSLRTNHNNEICDITILDLDIASPLSLSKEHVRNIVTRTAPITEPVKLTDIAPVNFSKPSYSIKQMEQFKEFDEFNQLIDFIEDLYGRTLSHMELQTPAFLFEGLSFSTPLIQYLYEYCLSRNKKSSAYIEKVAREWAEHGVNTVEKAKSLSVTYTKEYNTVKTAFGITRSFGEVELKYLNHWFIELGMKDELVKEACSRTIIATGEPNFNYADKILEKWKKGGVTSMEQVAELDVQHAKRQTAQKHSSNKFTQFPQRNYSEDEYSSMEKRLLKRN